MNSLRKNISNLFGLLKDIGHLYVSVILLVLIALLSPAISYMYKLIVDAVSVSNLPIKQILIIVAMYMILQMISEILENLQQYFFALSEFKITNNIHMSINKKLKRVKIEVFEDVENFNLIQRISDKLLNGTMDLINTLFNILSPIIMVVSYTLILVTIKWYFPIILIISNIPYIISLFIQNRMEYDNYKEISMKNRQLNYWINVLTQRSWVKDVKIYNLFNYINIKICRMLEEICLKENSIIKRNLVINLLANLVKNLSICICLIVVLVLIFKGEATIGEFALVYSVTQNIINNLSVSLSQFASIDELFIYLKDWNDFLELEEENNAHKLTSNFDINFKNVYFNYPNQELKVINGLNLSIPYGEKVVIVGENGSGKSTLISLLLGMYALNTGEIFIGKENINNVLYYYRKNISCMFQNYLKLQLSVRDNINIGNLDVNGG